MNLRYKSNPHLDRLEKILNIQPDKAAPTPAYFFPDVLGSASMLAAVIFTPVIIWSLFKLKRYGWLISFVLTVLLPAGIIRYASVDWWLWPALYTVPLLFLVIFHFVLRQVIHDWRDPIFTNAPGSDYK
ncbi:MAG: hypothetical protein WD016_10130 [Balneolaceae bacterium]